MLHRFLLLCLLWPALAGAAPTKTITVDIDKTEALQSLTFLQATDPRVAFKLMQGGRPYTDLSGYTAKFMYGTSITGAAVTVESETTDPANAQIVFQFDSTDTNTNGTFRAVLLVEDSSTNRFYYGQVNLVITRTSFTTGADELDIGQTVDWIGTEYENTAIDGPYRAGSNVVFTANGDGSVDINADVSAGSGDLTAVTSTDSSITVTSGAGPIPNVALPSTLPARNGSLLTALNASSLGSGTVPTARLGSGTANSGAYLTGAQTWAQLPFPTTNSVRAATADVYIPFTGGDSSGWLGAKYGANDDLVRIGEDPDSDLYGGIFWRDYQDTATVAGIRMNLITGMITMLQNSGGWRTILDTASIMSPGQINLAATGDIPYKNALGYIFPLAIGTSGQYLRSNGTIPTWAALSASDVSTGTLALARLPSAVTTPMLAWASTDMTFHTTAGVWWYPYENTSLDFGADGLRAAAADDQTGTLRTSWRPTPSNASAYKETGCIVVSFAVSATTGVTEIRGLRLMGKSTVTGSPVTVYTDTTVRDGDAVTAGNIVSVSINRSALSTNTLYAYLQAEIDVSVEDGEVLAMQAFEVRFE